VPLACSRPRVELRGQADVNDECAAADAAALLRFLQRRGVIAAIRDRLPERAANRPRWMVWNVLAVPAAGVLVYRKPVG